jgi:tyrosine-protein kinase Etk/Wzc
VISSLLLSILLPNQYTATITLMPPQQNSSTAAALASQFSNFAGGMAALGAGSLGLKNPNDMYVAMLRSRTVEDAMVKQFELMREYHVHVASVARKAFEHNTKLDASGKDGLIHISVQDRNPSRAAELANGYVDQFHKLTEHLAITEASQRRLFFQQQLEQAKDNLANAEEAMKQTELQTGLIQVDSQARTLIEFAASLRAEITAKEVEINSLQTFATNQNAQLVQAQEELDSLRSQLAKLGGSGNGADSSLIVPKGRVPEASLEYVRKLRNVKYYETIFDILARQFELAKLDEAKQGALFQVVDAAVPPDIKSSPYRSLIVVGVTLGGFLLGVLFALFQTGLERMKSESRTREKLQLFQRSLSLRN